MALPYIVFSVYYQWKVAKQWCVLCLGVQGLLLLGVVNAFASHLLNSTPAFSILFLTKVLCCYGLPMLAWYAAKPLLLGIQQAKNTKREYLRIKFNGEVFSTLLSKQKAIISSTEGLGIDLGNPKATHTLVKVCSPTCGPCSRAHPAIDSLLESNSNLRVKIIFTTPGKQDHPAYPPANHLMAIAGNETGEEAIIKALDNWYLPLRKDYEVFAKKHPLNGELQMQDEKLDAMHHWCEENQVQATPTFFLNGKELPNAYSISDLSYFLLE